VSRAQASGSATRARTRCTLSRSRARIGYTWADKKYEIAAFCRNCTDQIRAIGGINFENTTGMINDPRIIGGQLSMKF